MLRKSFAFSLALGMVFCAAAVAQQQSAPDPQIAAAHKQVSPPSLKAEVEKLASFHFRNRPSSADPKDNEIGAAREWIESQFDRYSRVRGALTEFRENYHHQHLGMENGIEYGDLLEFVDYEYLANVARLNVATLASLASAPAPPASVPPETRVGD